MNQSNGVIDPRIFSGAADFRDGGNSEEPCFLSVRDLEEVPRPDGYDTWRHLLVVPKDVITVEPKLWVEALFEPGDLLEFRCLPPKQTTKALAPAIFLSSALRRKYVLTPWFRADRIDRVLGDLTALNSQDGVRTLWGKPIQGTKRLEILPQPGVPLNVYVSANPRSSLGGTRNADVPFARSLFVDLDGVTTEDAVARLEQSGLPRPTMTIHSGHGVHAYWRLIEPPTDLALWSSIQKGLIGITGADPSVHDAARVMRLPGFMNWNGEPARCEIVEVDPSRRYTLDEFLRFVPVEWSFGGGSKEATGRQVQVHLDPQANEGHLDADSVLRRALAYSDQVEQASEGQRNSRLFSLCTSLVEKFDLDEEGLRVVAGRYNSRLEEPLDEGEVEEVARNGLQHVRAKDTPRGTLLAGHHEALTEDHREVVPLDRYREDLVRARLESLDRPGIYYDGSPTGSGKSTADIEAIRRASRSLTLLPTHSACEELVETLSKSGIEAAAYPAVTEQTCRRYGTKDAKGDARIAQEAGLIVGVALCPTCPLAQDCDYQRRRAAAQDCRHAVATHARAASSSFAIASNKPLVLIHEDPLGLLRPMVKITSKKLSKTVPCLDDLEEVARIFNEAVVVAERMGDRSKVEFAQALRSSTDELIRLLDTGATQAELSESPRVRIVPKKPKVDRPEWTDVLLYRAIRSRGIDPNGAALKLAVAHACDEIEALALVVEDSYRKPRKGEPGGAKEYHLALVGVWRVDLPEDAVVWIEDATGDRGVIEGLVGRKVQDMTPEGQLEHQIAPVQYASTDITQSTSGNIVRGLIRGLLARHQTARRVGIITHQVHLGEIARLEQGWADRIARIEYYHSGHDRASNTWLDCGLIIVLGTPRVPPSAVRDGLIQIGRLEEAEDDGGWGYVAWEGRTEAGETVSATWTPGGGESMGSSSERRCSKRSEEVGGSPIMASLLS